MIFFCILMYFAFYVLHTTLYTPCSTLYTLHSTFYTLHFTLLTPHSTLHTLHFTLYTSHSSHFTLHTWRDIIINPYNDNKIGDSNACFLQLKYHESAQGASHPLRLVHAFQQRAPNTLPVLLVVIDPAGFPWQVCLWVVQHAKIKNRTCVCIHITRYVHWYVHMYMNMSIYYTNLCNVQMYTYIYICVCVYVWCTNNS